MICLLPPRRPLCLEEEVADNEEDDEDNDDDDNDVDAATANDGNEDMPPKAKTTVAKGTANSTKPPATTAAADTVMPPPAAKTKPLEPYSINVRDAAVITYYNNTAVDYTEVEIHVNGVVPEGSCKFTVATDCMSISWQRATDKICFASEHLKAIMKNDYSMSHNRVIAYNNVAQKMIGNKVTPDTAGRFWGAPQVIKLKAHITGTPKESCLPYRTAHTAEWKGKAHRQFNTLCHCKVQQEKQRFTNMVKAER
jgi:hypothetical protein